MIPTVILYAMMIWQQGKPDAFQKQLDESIWPRDIFAVVRGEEKSPVRGWKLDWSTVLEYDGSVDIDEEIVTATKAKEKAYFHVRIASGYEEKTGQSLYEIRVKQVDSPEEDWSHNKYWDEGEWLGEKGKSKHWVPNEDDPTVGFCSNSEMTTFPMTKEECFHPKGQP